MDGAIGPQGPAGTNGADGAQGPAGTNGVDGVVGPQGPAGTNGVDGAMGSAGPVTNQVMDVNGVLYTITNTPSEYYVLKFNPANSTAWFAAETWEGISNSVVYTNSPAKACHTPVTLTQTGDTVTITSAASAYQQITLTNNVTFTFDTSFSTNDSCFVNLALYCNNFPVTFDSNTISAATTTNINLATNEWNSLIFHRGCRQAVWSVR
ncbi:MAG: collagen-like protein [Verrucomicrobia bacterium]|nr:collagen-like protein [Verrucomicrobiota bacterium]MBU4291393.1 collagen-like protein [Verrucomicrobiota bacterium]MBU4497436.1 collagen-like protein [Verrucomicrobiota bacterium]